MNVTHGVVLLARSGYAARGVVYVIIGIFAFTAALGSGRTVDSKGAVEQLLSQPFGTALLWLLVIGLLAHVIWRLTQAIGDTDRHGTGAKGLLVRAGLIGSGITNLLLALFALGVLGSDLASLTGDGSGSGGGNGDFLSRFLGWRNSNLVIYLLALIPLGVGVAHLIKAWRGSFERYFQCDEQKMRLITPVSRIGLVARGSVFLIISALLLVGGNRYEPTDPPGLKEALQALQGLPLGWLLLGAVGLGLLAFALYSFAQALWRRIDLSEVTG
ncbi:DUF1206 domain-containing protein [Stutzerimonas azotifigens]|uniref:DUF1206 domain-containing protein n=1 Tax=Stutzerimonas azotifigens TaxID=291995 RepID=A0ABR5YW99_9GAMM|nr:DUF1206 domain-containing protein [Stutzerimonas azotifigens]MBA1272187.1 DUF1206 domain-containing protein [Stutzerimonas azotifigens]